MSNFFTYNKHRIGNKSLRNVLVQTDHGMMIVNRFDCNNEMVGHGQWLLDHGNCSTIEAETCLSSLTCRNPIIFDIGANIGTLTTWFAKTYPDGTIFSFEPQPQVFYKLCGNIAINNLYNVRAFNIGVGNKNHYLTTYEPNYFDNADFGTFSLLEEILTPTKVEIIVEIKTVDWIVTHHKLPRVNLLKIDVEGMDIDVLLGAKNTIDAFHPNVFIEHNNNIKSTLKEIDELFASFKYNKTVIGNNVLYTAIN